ncbi:MAG TPA: hypothetical protein VIH90_05580 [Candidatus Saccharimonadales bacterium]
MATNQTMIDPLNPFEATPYDSSYMDIVTRALKRGPKGEGEEILVIVPWYGEVAVLGALERERIAELVDSAAGEDAALVVAQGLAEILHDTITRQGLAT